MCNIYPLPKAWPPFREPPGNRLYQNKINQYIKPLGTNKKIITLQF